MVLRPSLKTPPHPGRPLSDHLQILNSFDCFECVLMSSECGETEESFAVGTEAGAWGSYDVGFLEGVVEEFPGGHFVWGFEPDVWGV